MWIDVMSRMNMLRSKLWTREYLKVKLLKHSGKTCIRRKSRKLDTAR